MKHRKGIFILLFLILIYLILGSFIGFENTCIIKNTTGLPCPGCGLTRSGLSLLKFDISSAIKYNAMIFVIFIATIVVIFKDKFSKLYNSNIFWSLCIIIVISYYIFRMIHYFPDTIPMDFKEDAIIPKILKLLKTTSIT